MAKTFEGTPMDLTTTLIVGGMSAICVLLPTLLVGMAIYTNGPSKPRR